MGEFLDDAVHPDAADVVVAHLRAQLPDVPDDLIDVTNPDRILGPAARVDRVGGVDDGVDDLAQILVTAMDRTYDGAARLATRVRKVMAGDLGVGGLNDTEVLMSDHSLVWVAGCRTDDAAGIAAARRGSRNHQAVEQVPTLFVVAIPAQ